MLRAVLISLLFIVSLIFVFQNQLIFLDEYTIYLDFFFYKIGEKTVPLRSTTLRNSKFRIAECSFLRVSQKYF